MIFELQDVFLVDLPRLPPDKDVDFANNLELSTKPISVLPYQIVSTSIKISVLSYKAFWIWVLFDLAILPWVLLLGLLRRWMGLYICILIIGS